MQIRLAEKCDAIQIVAMLNSLAEDIGDADLFASTSILKKLGFMRKPNENLMLIKDQQFITLKENA